jgi:Kdo2-lipid IVA lauroyltransferase/acyltransferase
MLFFTRLTSFLPLYLNRLLGLILGYLLYFFKNKPYKITQTNLQLCFPELDTSSIKKLCLQSLVQTGKMLCENGIIFLGKNKRPLKYIKNVYGLDELNDAIQQGKGVTLAVPHLGSWELLILYCSEHYATTVLYRPLKSKSFNQLVLNARQRYGAKLKPTDNSGVRALYKAMKNKEIAIVLPDHEPKWGGGIFSKFFNQDAYTSTLIPKLSIKTGATVLVAYVERLEGSKGFNLHFKKMPSLDNIHIEEGTATLNHSIETVIKEHVQQYLWIYKRFRTRPDGEKNIY